MSNCCIWVHAFNIISLYKYKCLKSKIKFRSMFLFVFIFVNLQPIALSFIWCLILFTSSFFKNIYTVLLRKKTKSIVHNRTQKHAANVFYPTLSRCILLLISCECSFFHFILSVYRFFCCMCSCFLLFCVVLCYRYLWNRLLLYSPFRKHQTERKKRINKYSNQNHFSR